MRSVVITLLICIAIFFVFDKSKYRKDEPIIITTIDTLEIPHDSIIYRPGKKILKDTTIYDTIALSTPVDTMAILKDYFAKNIYKDTIKIQDGSIAITDTISKNAIFGRSVHANITHKIIKETRELRIPYKPKNELFLGAYGGLNTIGVGLSIKTKKSDFIGISYSNNGIGFNYYKKIF
jgi:hypothetical protein